MPHRAVEQSPVISLRRCSYEPCRDREMRLDDGDAWRLIKIVFWGILLLLGIRLALALMLDDIDTARLPSPDLRLPYNSEGGNILGMGRDPIKNQTPDLFSTERLGGLRPTDRQMR